MKLTRRGFGKAVAAALGISLLPNTKEAVKAVSNSDVFCTISGEAGSILYTFENDLVVEAPSRDGISILAPDAQSTRLWL